MVDSDLTVVAAGRRSALPDWLEAIGVDVPADEEEDTGIVYLSRFYRLNEGEAYPPRSGPVGGDLGYIKYGIFVGDNNTFSLTLAVPTADDELRRRLADPDNFEEAGRRLVVVAPYLDGRATPLSDDIHVMAGLINRWREHVIDGEPLAVGVIPIGDAALCTNPLHGRGCSTGYWGAHLLTDAVQRHGDDVRAIGLDYDEALRREILPWYRATVTQDAEARRVAAALLAGEDPDGDVTDPRTQMRAVFRDGLLPALQIDADRAAGVRAQPEHAQPARRPASATPTSGRGCSRRGKTATTGHRHHRSVRRPASSSSSPPDRDVSIS